jgi:hypothetical protein
MSPKRSGVEKKQNDDDDEAVLRAFNKIAEEEKRAAAEQTFQAAYLAISPEDLTKLTKAQGHEDLLHEPLGEVLNRSLRYAIGRAKALQARGNLGEAREAYKSAIPLEYWLAGKAFDPSFASPAATARIVSEGLLSGRLVMERGEEAIPSTRRELLEKEVNPGILEDGRVGSRTERLPAGDLDKREHSKTDLIARLEEVEAAAREVCPEIIPGLRRSKIIAKGMPPKWGDPDLPENLKVLTAPLFLKHFYPDLIIDGVVDRSVIREFDRGLMADIEQYIFRRKKRKLDLGDATGLRFVGGRFDEQQEHGGSFRKKSTGGRPERKARRSIRAATP